MTDLNDFSNYNVVIVPPIEKLVEIKLTEHVHRVTQENGFTDEQKLAVSGVVSMLNSAQKTAYFMGGLIANENISQILDREFGDNLLKDLILGPEPEVVRYKKDAEQFHFEIEDNYLGPALGENLVKRLSEDWFKHPSPMISVFFSLKEFKFLQQLSQIYRGTFYSRDNQVNDIDFANGNKKLVEELTTLQKWQIFEQMYYEPNDTWKDAHRKTREYLINSFEGISKANIDKFIHPDHESAYAAYRKYKREHRLSWGE